MPPHVAEPGSTPATRDWGFDMDAIRKYRLAVLLATMLASGEIAVTRANDDLPVKVDFIFRFDVRLGPTVMVPPDLAPWYQWFPYDPNMVSSPAQSTPYPHWPNQFPPAGSNTGTRQQGALTPQPIQRVGFPANGVPSYWYSR